MYTKENFWKSLQNEIRIIKHLATKALPEKMDYRPTEKSRTTIELMQYLSATGMATMKVLLNEDMKMYSDYDAFKSDVSLENFSEKMDYQEKEMKEIFSKFTENDFGKEFDYYGVKTKAEHLVDGVLKNFAAYRMQLFVYLKTSCDENLNTYNVWVGMDSPKN